MVVRKRCEHSMYCGCRDLERDGMGRAEGAHAMTVMEVEEWEVGGCARDSPRSDLRAGGWWGIMGEG